MKALVEARKPTYSKKWSRYGTKDILPFWIADMDFKSPDFLAEHLNARAKMNYFGYTDIPQQVNQGISSWYKQQYGCEVKETEILFSTSVLHSYRVTLETCINAGGKIMLFTPIYPPLMTIAKKCGIEVIEVPLSKSESGYQIDFERAKQILNEDQKVESIVLCNPHNPVGRVWNSQEINEIKMLAKAKNLYLISDEIHGDLVFKNYTFNSVLHTCDTEEKVIVLSSPAKTFNVAGIKASHVIVKNSEIRNRLAPAFKANGLNDLDIFAIETLDCLYGNYEKAFVWLNNLIEVLEDNYHYLEKTFAVMERVELAKSEGSYLAWLKIVNSPCNDSYEIRTVLKEKYGVDVHEGTIFKENDGNYIRINFGCPIAALKKGMARLTKAIEENEI